jgi:hypothetical protein
MQFVKFGEEYVPASRIVSVVFRTNKEVQPSDPDPFLHKPQPRDKDVAVALVKVEGRTSDLEVRGATALDQLQLFCEREAVAIF